MAQVCRECGASVADTQTICPRCNSVDLAPVSGGTRPAAGGDTITAYHHFERGRRLAMAVTVTTTTVLILVALALGIMVKELLPAGGSGAGGPGKSFSAFETIRLAVLFIFVNPIVLVGLALALGLLSYRLWYRLFTGERPEGGFSMLDAMSGRAQSARTR